MLTHGQRKDYFSEFIHKHLLIFRADYDIIVKQKNNAGMMELADVSDSKSDGSDTVRVRPPLPAPENDKFLLKLVVFSYIRLTASDMHIWCVIFASQVILPSAVNGRI